MNFASEPSHLRRDVTTLGGEGERRKAALISRSVPRSSRGIQSEARVETRSPVKSSFLPPLPHPLPRLTSFASFSRRLLPPTAFFISLMSSLVVQFCSPYRHAIPRCA
jgi:hypothetical protein